MIKAVALFENEVGRIKELDIKAFIGNALEAAPQSFKEDANVIEHTRKVFNVVEALLDHDGVEGIIRDMILAGTLLCDVAIHESGEFPGYHPVLGRAVLNKVAEDLNTQVFDGILRIVEKHEGNDTPISELAPKPGTPEHLVALAQTLVRSNGIDVTIK